MDEKNISKGMDSKPWGPDLRGKGRSRPTYDGPWSPYARSASIPRGRSVTPCMIVMALWVHRDFGLN